jgi:hypothetical protein
MRRSVPKQKVIPSPTRQNKTPKWIEEMALLHTQEQQAKHQAQVLKMAEQQRDHGLPRRRSLLQELVEQQRETVYATGTVPMQHFDTIPSSGDQAVEWQQVQLVSGYGTGLLSGTTIPLTGSAPDTIRTDWLKEAAQYASTRDAFITINIEDKGIAVTAQAGDDYQTHIITWRALEAAPFNVILKAVDYVDQLLRSVQCQNSESAQSK